MYQFQFRNRVPAAAPAVLGHPGRLLQRSCACGGSAASSGGCEKCEGASLSLQRATEDAAREPLNTAGAPPIVCEALSSSGQPLDSETRALMEPHFGHDFSRVRVHADAKAAESAQAVNALAYTVGNDVAFAPNQYSPATTEGKRLLAHELTHVVQQSSGSGSGVQRQEAPKETPAAATTPADAGTTTATTPTTAAATATPAAVDPAKLSGTTWWNANESKAPYTKSDSISDLEADFQTKVTEFKGALDAAGASISIDTTKRPAERAWVLHYAWVIAKDGFKASDVPAKDGVDIIWDHGDAAKSKAGANEIVTAASVASKPSLTSNHIAGKAIDWTITWTGDLKIKKKDGTEATITSAPKNGGDPGNTELHAVGKDYGVIKGLFTTQKKDPPHWSSDGT